ncbi:MAG: hypothetical protein CM1200mP22_15620 [Dehalococcoidia bacterium]|nr:MAG: hypothetical protein CM1200mP22_15620 [Dehalococcoidia bacterium]
MAQYDRAIEDYCEAIQLNPVCAEAYHNRAVAFNRLGNYGESERDFAKVAELQKLADNESPEGSQ